MNIFDDYKNWKKDNSLLLKNLESTDSPILSYIKPVIIVLDYLYKQTKKRELEEDESYSFSFGFNFLFNRVSVINTLLEENLKGDLFLLRQMTSTICLYLHILDIMEAVDETLELEEIESYLISLFNKKINISKENLDKIYLFLDNLYYDESLEFVEDIFYEMGELYNLYHDEDEAYEVTGVCHEH